MLQRAKVFFIISHLLYSWDIKHSLYRFGHNINLLGFAEGVAFIPVIQLGY